MSDAKKVFITGATGLVGSHLARRLLADNWAVHALTRPSSDTWRLQDILPRLNIHVGDLRDRSALEKIIVEIQPQGIFHLAVSNMASGVMAPNQDVVADNLLGTVNLIDAADKVDYDFFINTGSFLEYGVKTGPVKESDKPEPPELYSITKLAAEQYAHLTAKSKRKPIVTLRLFTPYGPAVQPGRLIYEIVTKALKNEDIILSSPNVSRDFIYVQDVVSAYQAAAERARDWLGETFNVGSGVSTTIGEVVDFMLKETQSTSKVQWGSHQGAVYDSDFWQADMTKIRNSLEWKPKYSLEAGLLETIKWYKTHL